MLRVARTSKRNTQQNTEIEQQRMQQTMQQPSLKALAARVLARSERNETRNNRAAAAQKPCNNVVAERAPFVAYKSPLVAPIPDGLRTWWWIYRNGLPLCQMMALGGLTREEALHSAQGRWPDGNIEVPQLDLDGRLLPS